MAELILSSVTNIELAEDDKGQTYEVCTDLEFVDGNSYICVTSFPERQNDRGDLIEDRHLDVRVDGQTVFEPNGAFPYAHFDLWRALGNVITFEMKPDTEQRAICSRLLEEWYRSSPLFTHLG